MNGSPATTNENPGSTDVSPARADAPIAHYERCLGETAVPNLAHFNEVFRIG